jgi:hypothetical protein
MSEALARQIFARDSADALWRSMSVIRELLADGEGAAAEDQLSAIKRIVEVAKRDLQKYEIARGFSDGTV